MEGELTSEGKCIYCNEIVSQNKIIKHLAKHLAVLEKEKSDEKEKGFHLSIKAGEMFLEVVVRGSATFQTLDNFLRNIWVDCCGHMSNFRHKNFNISTSEKFFRVLSPKLKFEYIYDYGSTTSFTITVAGVYQLNPKENVVLLSRNEPLKIMCDVCHKRPATTLCSVHLYESEESFFCESCAVKHEKKCDDFADYAAMPVVNSPRMGVCGYEGGSIDKDRDSSFKA